MRERKEGRKEGRKEDGVKVSSVWDSSCVGGT